MISFEEAYELVQKNVMDFGKVEVPLSEASGYVLAEDIVADRDFPPFNRATKDGIAIRVKDQGLLDSYGIGGIVAAGTPPHELPDANTCLEIMTGAIVPQNADTVVMYEHLEMKQGRAYPSKGATMGQNIHYKGSDEAKGNLLLSEGKVITPAEIGVLASVGKADVLVKRKPKIALLSTGDELVPVNEVPELHQIRQSNGHVLSAALSADGVDSTIIHVPDNRQTLLQTLDSALKNNDVLLISGGVSKGKFDYLPGVLEELGVEKCFHRVLQRPGKPFWFGINEETKTTVFGFPGNPSSTFANFHVYFKPWLKRCLGLVHEEMKVILTETFDNRTDLTRFIRAAVRLEAGRLVAKLVHGNGSGDLTSLTKANGFIKIGPKREVQEQMVVSFFPTKQIV